MDNSRAHTKLPSFSFECNVYENIMLMHTSSTYDKKKKRLIEKIVHLALESFFWLISIVYKYSEKELLSKDCLKEELAVSC